MGIWGGKWGALGHTCTLESGAPLAVQEASASGLRPQLWGLTAVPGVNCDLGCITCLR